MSKPMTSVAAMILVEEGKLALGDPVGKYIPQIAEMRVGVEKPGADGNPTLELVAPRRQMTVQDLLRHTSGLTYGIFGSTLVKKQYLEAKLFDGDPTNAEFVERLVQAPPPNHPGTAGGFPPPNEALSRAAGAASKKTLSALPKQRRL